MVAMVPTTFCPLSGNLEDFPELPDWQLQLAGHKRTMVEHEIIAELIGALE